MAYGGRRHPEKAERADDIVARLEADQPRWLDDEIQRAKDFATLDKKNTCIFYQAASTGELASRMGYNGLHAQDLALAGHALLNEPAYEPLLRKGEIVFPQLTAVGAIYRDPDLRKEDDDWVHAVRFKRRIDLERMVRRRREEVKQRREVREYTAHIPDETREALKECQKLASKKAGHAITRGQTLAVVAWSYLYQHDIRFKPSRPRRVPHTATRPDDRYVPSEVERAIRERSGGLCEFGGCDRVAYHGCHLVPHRDGSPREIEDLVEGCQVHHKKFDDHEIRFLTWTDDRRPVFIVDATNEILAPKPPAEKLQPFYEDEWFLKATGASRARRKKKPGGPRDLGSDDLGSDDLGGAGLACDRAPLPGRFTRRVVARPAYHMLR